MMIELEIFFIYALFLAGKSVKDSQKLSELNVDKTGKIYFKDLGPQIGWSTVEIFRLSILYLKNIFYFRSLWRNMQVH
jgi:very-long-chain enoyl-CoA reductase